MQFHDLLSKFLVGSTTPWPVSMSSKRMSRKPGHWEGKEGHTYRAQDNAETSRWQLNGQYRGDFPASALNLWPSITGRSESKVFRNTQTRTLGSVGALSTPKVAPSSDTAFTGRNAAERKRGVAAEPGQLCRCTLLVLRGLCSRLHPWHPRVPSGWLKSLSEEGHAVQQLVYVRGRFDTRETAEREATGVLKVFLGKTNGYQLTLPPAIPSQGAALVFQ